MEEEDLRGLGERERRQRPRWRKMKGRDNETSTVMEEEADHSYNSEPQEDRFVGIGMTVRE